MNVTGVVFSAEFKRRISSRPFLVATIIGALSVVALAFLPIFIARTMNAESNRIVLVGDAKITSVAGNLLSKDYGVFSTLPKLGGTPDAAYLDAHGKASAVAVLTRAGDRLDVVIYARDPTAIGSAFGRDLAPLQIAFATGRPVADIQHQANVAVDVRGVGGRFRDASTANVAKGIAYLFIFLLYIGILLNAQAIMASVAEEKTSRIAELLVAAIDPAQLLTAKVLAAAACGAIQLGVWVVAGGAAGGAVVGFFAESSGHGPPVELGPIALPPAEVFALLAFFLVGFFQYSVLYAAAASLINRTEDLGSVAGPLVIPVVFGFALAQIALQSPNSIAAAVSSYLPLLAPFVMFTRIAVTNVPVWQVAISLILNVAAAFALAWLAGKVYRFGLLLYGRPPSLKQIWRIVRT